MEKITKEEIDFLEAFFKDEFTEDGIIELEKRMKNPIFKKYYQKKLEEKYKVTKLQLFIAYLPLLLLLGLIIVGIYLITTKM
jgi:Ca2+/Na+ antiporter